MIGGSTIKIARADPAHPDLVRFVWMFSQFQGRLRLTAVEFEERKTKRHKWVVTRYWSVYGTNWNTGRRYYATFIHVPPKMPADVLVDLHKELNAQVDREMALIRSAVEII